MEAFDLAQLLVEHKQANELYLEFLRVPALSVGLYKLPAGGVDPQQPHTEDEVYYIISGRGSIQVGEEHRAVEAGSVVFVQANVEHRFHTITANLTILVFFAPAEYTQATPRE